jgi:hypothetical protein
MLPACTGDKRKSCQQEHPDIKAKKESHQRKNIDIKGKVNHLERRRNLFSDNFSV